MEKVAIADFRKAPSTTGVYLFLKKSRPIYIGKAVNIKARLASHIEIAKTDRKEALIIRNSDSIGYMITDSEFNALLLESRLIKTHHPRYNVRWKDNKSYLYIKISIAEKTPKVLLSRFENDGKSRYFGPFPSVQAAENILRYIRRVFPFCTQKNITARACFYSKIGLCNPCPNKITSKQQVLEYRRNIRKVISILEGNINKILAEQKEILNLCTREQRYEDALKIRNRIQYLEKLIYQSRFAPEHSVDQLPTNEAIEGLINLLQGPFSNLRSLHRIECYDISVFAQKEPTASMVVLIDGKIDRAQYRKFKIKNKSLRSDFEMLEEVLGRRFKNNWTHPDLLVVDGGKPQVRTIIKVINKLALPIPVIGIAKAPDRIVVGTPELQTLRLAINNPAFNLIRHIRDESHRFARKYHLHLRKKTLF